MNVIKVKTKFESHDCDCCGYFDTGELTIKINGNTFKYDYDGHFGGGYWSGDDDTRDLFILGAMFGVEHIRYQTPFYTHSIGDYDKPYIELDIGYTESTLIANGETITIPVGFNVELFKDDPDVSEPDDIRTESVTELILKWMCDKHKYLLEIK
jgi:hypothetical protein